MGVKVIPSNEDYKISKAQIAHELTLAYIQRTSQLDCESTPSDYVKMYCDTLEKFEQTLSNPID